MTIDYRPPFRMFVMIGCLSGQQWAPRGPSHMYSQFFPAAWGVHQQMLAANTLKDVPAISADR